MELKKNGLYILDVEYQLEMESGETRLIRDKVFGYVVGDDSCYFHGLLRKGTGPVDAMIMTKNEFKDWVKSAREICD